MELPGGGGSVVGCQSTGNGIEPDPTIQPARLMSSATPTATGDMTPSFQMKARGALSGFWLQPTMWPSQLIALALLEPTPPSVPRPFIVPFPQTNPRCAPSALVDQPTILPPTMALALAI